MSTTTASSVLRKYLAPLSFKRSAYDPLLNAVGNSQVVLIGDGSHGTYEFYAHRANITQRLIEEKGFNAIAFEADWPDAFRLNRYVHGTGSIKNARSALDDFERFPKWMWKNEVMPPFLDHMKEHNEAVIKSTGDPSKKVSFYGLDLYSLHRSADEVLRYLDRVDPEGAKAARKRYNCFERFGEDTTRYAYEAQFGLAKDCHQEVIRNLHDLLRNHQRYIAEQFEKDGQFGHPAQEQFMAEMNALVVRDAEEYYRTMMAEDTKSWNLRDDHFARVLVEIAHHLGTTTESGNRRADAKIVVWAHNSHIGDARATDMGTRRGEINVGQRCRELFGDDNVFNIGFLTGTGTVTAAYEWDEPPQLMTMNKPLSGSIEELLCESSDDDAIVIIKQIKDSVEGFAKKSEVSPQLTNLLNISRYQRFIGVIYRRRTEIVSHYSRCKVADQYDAIAIVKNSRGIQPLEREESWKGAHRGDLDLTFPFGY
ncbi:hypothetical protein BDY19DRAFT_982048 [Irpex rosettiformis]|uniref:Uncharacterized protein n=1 Tax=Irpex rosettiformis TaxID=378272 RepID=A0ACB8ULM3_9APHY|nr:hypothetical protein BDY19DRAFT_982048 [Irpex rosettiformis]